MEGREVVRFLAVYLYRELESNTSVEKEVNHGNCNHSGAEKLKGYRPTFHAGPSARQFSEFRFGSTASTRKVNQHI